MGEQEFIKARNKARPAVLRILRGFPDDVEDVLQTASLKAYVNADRFEGRSAFTSWFTRIAINEAFMFLRRQRAKPTVTMSSLDSSNGKGEMIPFDVVQNRLSPEQQVIGHERRARIAGLIRKLTPKLRAAMCSFLITGPHHQDNNEKSRLHRAKNNLRKKLDRQR